MTIENAFPFWKSRAASTGFRGQVWLLYDGSQENSSLGAELAEFGVEKWFGGEVNTFIGKSFKCCLPEPWEIHANQLKRSWCLVVTLSAFVAKVC